MKPLLDSFSIKPLAAALFLGGTLLAVSGCKQNDNDNTATDTTAPADTTPPASDMNPPTTPPQDNGNQDQSNPDTNPDTNP